MSANKYKRLELRKCSREEAADVLRRLPFNSGVKYGWREAAEQKQNKDKDSVYLEKLSLVSDDATEAKPAKE